MQLLQKYIIQFISELKSELNLPNNDNRFDNKYNINITYSELNKYLFNNLDIKWNAEIDIIWIDKNKYLDLIELYEKDDYIKSIKLKFIQKFLEKVKFCPYCWKVPLISFWIEVFDNEQLLDYFNISNEKLELNDSRLFDLDHIFPKATRKKKWKFYPHLAINIWNLIPCCKWCNFIKSDKNFLEWLHNDEKIFHPYFWWIVKSKNWLEILWWDFDIEVHKENNFTNSNLFNTYHFDFFKLSHIYLKSQDTKNDILFIRDKIEKLKASKNKKNINLNFLKKHYFENFYTENNQEYLNFANWKLKKDIINNIKL